MTSTHTIGSEKTRGLLLFHAFTGYDVVSAFSRKGKSLHDRHGMCFQRLPLSSRNSANTHHRLKMEDLENLEKFVVIMYDRPSTVERVDDARLDHFVRKQKSY